MEYNGISNSNSIMKMIKASILLLIILLLIMKYPFLTRLIYWMILILFIFSLIIILSCWYLKCKCSSIIYAEPMWWEMLRSIYSVFNQRLLGQHKYNTRNKFYYGSYSWFNNGKLPVIPINPSRQKFITISKSYLASTNFLKSFKKN